MFEAIGLFALIAFGIFLIVAGASANALTLGFAGKPHWPMFVVGVMGVAIIILSLLHSPFTLEVRHE